MAADWPARMGWTPELWDSFWRNQLQHHEELAEQARQQIGRLSPVKAHDDIHREGAK